MKLKTPNREYAEMVVASRVSLLVEVVIILAASTVAFAFYFLGLVVFGIV